ncbi:uncharacterized protein LOC103306663 isoform X2 [Chrysemys picta bellii]
MELVRRLQHVKKPVPLSSSSVSVLLRGFVADVSCELLYRNEEPGPVEVVFKFPVDAEAAVYAFRACLGGGLHPGPAPREETGAGAVWGRAGRGAELVPPAAGGGRGRCVQLLPGESAPREGGGADPALRL